MQKIKFILLIILFFKLDAESQSLENKFIKEVYKYKIDTKIDINVSVYYQDRFYCLRSDNQIFVIDNASQKIDSTFKDNSKKIKLLNIYVEKDMLIGTTKSNIYYFDTIKSKWRFLNEEWRTPPIYEDDAYIISATCSGEFGGSVYFKSKKDGEQYECSSTCAINVFKKENKYIVVSSLSHMIGFAKIFEIPDPQKMKLYNRDYREENRIRDIGEDESKSTLGTVSLIDSMGVIIQGGFQHNSNVYIITTNNDIMGQRDSVSLNILKDNKLILVDDLTDFDIADYNSENRTCGSKQIISFENDTNTGFLSIDKNKLTFYSFDRKTK